MARYISIKKLADNEEFAEYSFSNVDNQSGILRLEKASGRTVLVKTMPDDEKEASYQRAAYKLRKHWEAGELPIETCWAS